MHPQLTEEFSRPGISAEGVAGEVADRTSNVGKCGKGYTAGCGSERNRIDNLSKLVAENTLQLQGPGDFTGESLWDGTPGSNLQIE